MQVDTVTGAGHTTVELRGRFDAHEVAHFQSAVAASLAASGVVLRLDLGEVTFLDSSALAELLRARSQARAGGGDLVLTATSDAVRVILELTRLETVFAEEGHDRQR